MIYDTPASASLRLGFTPLLQHHAALDSSDWRHAEMFESYLISLAAGLTMESAKAVFSLVRNKRPDLVARAEAAQHAQNTRDIEQVFREAVGVIDAAAGSGEIQIDQATLVALKGIRFDHKDGQVGISGTSLRAPILVTGGGSGASGQTVVGGDTSLKSQGTEISVGKGASITMTGGARIKQT